MKLADIFEVNFPGGKAEEITAHDPSGNAGPMPVDPDDVEQMNRSKKLRRRVKLMKNMRKPLGSDKTMKGDNEDLTGSGAHSVVNGPFNY